MGLPIQFFWQNFHFAVNLLAALVVILVGWLYFDSWLIRRPAKDLWKWAGFFVLFLSFLIQATYVEQSFFSDSLFGQLTLSIAEVSRVIAYLAIIVGLILDPLQPIPETEGLSFERNPKSKKSDEGGLAVTPIFGFLLPLGSLAVAFLYARRAYKGLERHLKPVALAFLMMSISDLLSLAHLWRGSTNVVIFNLTAAFGPIWIIEQLFLLAAVISLGSWVWRYLATRIQSQLFVVTISMVTLIFLVVATSFTYLLARNVTTDSLNNLSVAAKVLNYALDSKKSETLAHAQALSSNPEITAAVGAGDGASLNRQTSTFLVDKKQSSLVFTNADGQVLFRAEDPTRGGDSLSSDTSIRRALIGKASSTIITRPAPVAPIVFLRSTSPITQGSRVVGTISVGLQIGNDFVDGIKKVTGLETAIYADDIRSATTLLAAGGQTRFIGVEEPNSPVKQTVLKEGREYQGDETIVGSHYLAVFAPIKDVDNVPVGMIFMGAPQLFVFQAASRSVELSFLIVTLLLLLSIFPAYRISRSIANQVS